MVLGKSPCQLHHQHRIHPNGCRLKPARRGTRSSVSTGDGSRRYSIPKRSTLPSAIGLHPICLRWRFSFPRFSRTEPKSGDLKRIAERRPLRWGRLLSEGQGAVLFSIGVRIGLVLAGKLCYRHEIPAFLFGREHSIPNRVTRVVRVVVGSITGLVVEHGRGRCTWMQPHVASIQWRPPNSSPDLTQQGS